MKDKQIFYRLSKMQLLTLIAMLIFFSCTPQMRLNTIHEDTLYVTRKYIGHFIKIDYVSIKRVFNYRATRIRTNECIVYIWGEQYLDIPIGTRCYIKYFPERIPGTNTKAWVLYLTWDGTDNFYRLIQDQITGKVYQKH